MVFEDLGGGLSVENMGFLYFLSPVKCLGYPFTLLCRVSEKESFLSPLPFLTFARNQ